MSEETITRKIFLALNKQYWEPNPTFAKFAKKKEWTTHQIEEAMEREVRAMLARGEQEDGESCEEEDN